MASAVAWHGTIGGTCRPRGRGGSYSTAILEPVDVAADSRSGPLASDAADAPARLDADPDNWFDAAESIPGSWWPAWSSWLASHGGRRVAAPKEPGNAEFVPIEEAPGSYVKEKAS